MENVGGSKNRNDSFKETYSREKLITDIVKIENPIIFDIGAHKGESVLFFKKLFPKPIIYSFEPDKNSFEKLKERCSNFALLYNFGFSDIEGDVIFYSNNISHTNSIYKVNLNSEDSISLNEAKKINDNSFFDNFNNETLCTFKRLDKFIYDNKIPYIDLLKIDVQGAEAKVLLGSGDLSNVRVLIVEISFFDYYEHQSSFYEIESILIPLGFKMYTISEISYNPMNGRTDWVEVVYRNEAKL